MITNRSITFEVFTQFLTFNVVRIQKFLLFFSCWDPCYDLDLMIDRVSIDLLYLQVIEELDLGWVTIDQEAKDILSSYEAQKQKREVRFLMFLRFWLTYCNTNNSHY